MTASVPKSAGAVAALLKLGSHGTSCRSRGVYAPSSLRFGPQVLLHRVMRGTQLLLEGRCQPHLTSQLLVAWLGCERALMQRGSVAAAACSGSRWSASSMPASPWTVPARYSAPTHFRNTPHMLPEPPTAGGRRPPTTIRGRYTSLAFHCVSVSSMRCYRRPTCTPPDSPQRQRSVDAVTVSLRSASA